MAKYLAVMINEIGMEFSVEFESQSDESAFDYLDDNYPESRVAELGDSSYWQQKEAERFNRLESEFY